MALTVFCGAYQPELELAFIGRLRAAGPGPGRRVAVVAPSRRLADRLQRLVAAESGLALLGARFHTFHSLALEIVESSGAPTPTSGQLSSGAVAEGALDKTIVGDGLFHDTLVDRLLAARPGGARLSRGLASAYRASLRDLIDAGVDPAALRGRLDELVADPADRGRLADLLELGVRYLAALESAKVAAPSGLARLATAMIEEGRATGLADYAELLYYGFYDLTGAQADFFRAVAGAGQASVFFPYRKGHPAFRFAERFYEVHLGSGVRAPGPSSLVERGPAAPSAPASPAGPALGAAFDCLFSPDRRAVAPPGALTVVNASGTRDEAWAVAKRILALRDGGAEFGGIGVVARTLEPYRAVLADVLGDNGIPFSMGSAEPLLRHPAAKLALTLLTLARRDFPARAVLDVTGSPYFRGEASPDWPRLVDRLGIHSGWLQWEGKLAPLAGRDFELYPRLVEEGREGRAVRKEDSARLWRLLGDLKRDLAGPPGRGWAAMTAHALVLIERHLAVGEEDPGARAWEAAREAVSGLSVYGSAAPDADWDDFLDAVEEKLRRASLEPGGGGLGVRVLDAMDARGESFRHLFLIGLQEGMFPRQVREDPLLPDAVRARLQHPAGYWILPKGAGYEEERLLFALLAASASEGLVCVYQRSDDSGKAVVPSAYLRELCRACGVELGSPEEARVPRQPLAKLDAVAPRLLSLSEIALRLSGRGEPAEAFLSALGVEAASLDESIPRARSLARRGEPGPLDGLVGEPVEYLARAGERGWSPSALEEYAACPFRFFASRLLGLRENEEPSERGELTALVRGDLYHRVLQRFHEELAKESFRSAPRERPWLATLERVVEEVLAPGAWRGLGVYPLLWEAARRRMSERLRAFVEWDLRRAGESGLWPALFETEIAAVVGGLRLRGRLDRVDLDTARSRLRVVDYKSRGSAKGVLAEVRSMRKLQPPLYLELALAGGLAAAGAEPDGAYLYCIEGDAKDDAGPVAQEYSAAEWRSARAGVLRGLAGLVEGIARGEFVITVDERRGAGVCEHCRFPAVCRKAHPATLRRARAFSLRRGRDAPRGETEEP